MNSRRLGHMPKSQKGGSAKISERGYRVPGGYFAKFKGEKGRFGILFKPAEVAPKTPKATRRLACGMPSLTHCFNHHPGMGIRGHTLMPSSLPHRNLASR